MFIFLVEVQHFACSLIVARALADWMIIPAIISASPITDGGSIPPRSRRMGIIDKTGVRKAMFDIFAVSPSLSARNRQRYPIPLEKIPIHKRPAISPGASWRISERDRTVMRVNRKQKPQ